MSDETTLTERHRQVSLHVLNDLPIKPMRAETLPWPIAFLTDDCKEAARTDGQSKYSPREKNLSKRIFGWRGGLDVQITELLEKSRKPIKLSSGDIFWKPIVIRALSGLGKSILIGKVIAELINSNENSLDNEWPKFDKILFSQLKDSKRHSELEKAVCMGLDVNHRCDELNQLFENVKGENGQKIIFIDSLDEHEKSRDWWDITSEFSKKGWIVVWTCRDPDWAHHKLGNFESEGGIIPDEISNIFDKGQEPWQQFRGKNWALEIGDHVQKLLTDNKYSNDENNKADMDFAKYCYSTTQLMHIFHTNFGINDEVREKLQGTLISTLFQTKDANVMKFKDNGFDVFEEDKWSLDLFSSNLARIIIHATLDYISEQKNIIFEGPVDVNQLWNDICNKYFQKEYDARNISELNESLPIDQLTDDHMTLVKYLTAFGILREGCKFRHRDFATISYVEGCGESGLQSMNEKDKSDILFKHFFPNSVLQIGNQKIEKDTESSSEDGQSIIGEFIRRNGNVLVYLNPIDNLIQQLRKSTKPSVDEPWDKYFIPKISMNIYGIITPTDDLSSSQIQALMLGQESEHSIILKGYPGSGKTYTGVEAIIFRQAQLHRLGRTDAFSLIVALNDQLAKSIERELEDNHKKSKYLEEFSYQEKTEIIEKIHVRSLKTLIGEWAPDFLPKEGYLLDSVVNEIFSGFEEKEALVDSDHRELLISHYRTKMFDQNSRELRNEEKYLSKVESNEKELCELWYAVIKDAHEERSRWLIDGDRLNEIFTNLMKREKIVDVVHWRLLEDHFQTEMFDKRSGRFITLVQYLSRVKDPKKKELCRLWYEAIANVRAKGEYSVVECCTVLRNRLLINEEIKSGVESNLENNKKYSCSLSRQNDQTLNKSQYDAWKNKLEIKTQQESYDIVMIDEVQDLPPMASVMLSFICADRASTSYYNRFIIAGDHLQTLNGMKFKWKDFLNTVTDLVGKISTDFKYIYSDTKSKRPTQHHLRGLFWDAKDREKALDEKFHLKDNHRNHSEIMELTKYEWKEWMPNNGSERENIGDMKSKWKRHQTYIKYRIMRIDTLDDSQFITNIKQVLEFLNSRAKVSLLYTNKTIQNFVEKEIMAKDDTKKMWVESFDPWTIKGLERDSVVIIGPYTASDKDPDSRELFINKLNSELKSEDLNGAIELMRRKMLVSNTRAMSKLIVLNAPKGHSKLGKSSKYQIKLLQPPKLSPNNEDNTVIELSMVDDLTDYMTTFFDDIDRTRKTNEKDQDPAFIELKKRKTETSIITIGEGMELISRASTKTARDKMRFFREGRLMTVIEQDPENSILRKILRDLLKIEGNPSLKRSLLLQHILKFINIDEELPSEYKQLYDTYNDFIADKDGPWKSKGYDRLYNIIRIISDLYENIEKLRSYYYTDEVGKEENSPAVKMFLDAIEIKFKEISDDLKLPSYYLTKKQLAVFLLSSENEIINSEKGNTTFTNMGQNDILRLVVSLTENIQIDNTGKIMANLDNNSRPLELREDYWGALMNELQKTEPKKEVESEKMLSFSKRYLKLYSKWVSEREKTNIPLENYQNEHYKISMNLLMRQKSNTFKSCKSEIKHYVNFGCPGHTTKDISVFIENLTTKFWGVEEIFTDNEILKWEINQFCSFVKRLQIRYDWRAEKLVQESLFIERFIEGQMRLRSTEDISLHSIKEASIRYLIEDSSLNEGFVLVEQGTAFEFLINQMIAHHLHYLEDDSKNYNIKKLESVVLAQALLPIETPNFEQLLARIPVYHKSNYTDSLIEECKEIMDIFHEKMFHINSQKQRINPVKSPRNPFSANARHINMAERFRFKDLYWILIKNTILIKKLAHVSNVKIEFIDNYPAMHLSMAFGVEQSNIFSRKEKIGVEENIKIVNNVYSNWNEHKKIFDLFYDSAGLKLELNWRFDGFGKGTKGNFSRSMELNEKFSQMLTNHDPSDPGQYFLLESFNLMNRYEKYIQVIDTLLHYIGKSISNTINLSTLIQNVLFGINKTSQRPFEEVLNLKRTANESSVLEANIFPCNCMETGNKHSCWGPPIKFKKEATTTQIIGDLQRSAGIVKLILELGVKVGGQTLLLSAKNIEDSILNLTDTRTNLASFITDQGPHGGEEEGPHRREEEGPHGGVEEGPHRGVEEGPHRREEEGPHGGEEEGPHGDPHEAEEEEGPHGGVEYLRSKFATIALNKISAKQYITLLNLLEELPDTDDE